MNIATVPEPTSADAGLNHGVRLDSASNSEVDPGTLAGSSSDPLKITQAGLTLRSRWGTVRVCANSILISNLRLPKCQTPAS